MRIVRGTLRHWLPLAVIVTLLAGLCYGAIQQVLRQQANDPQVQMAEDAGRALAGSPSAESVVPAAKVDIARSLAPYLVVYDDSGKPIASSGFLHDQLPALPPGVFDYARNHSENRITWQPEPGVRSAIVVVRYTGARSGFVMAGRSLRETENRVSALGLIIGAGWAVTVLAALGVVAFCEAMFAF